MTILTYNSTLAWYLKGSVVKLNEDMYYGLHFAFVTCQDILPTISHSVEPRLNFFRKEYYFNNKACVTLASFRHEKLLTWFYRSLWS